MDIDERFRKELRGQRLSGSVALSGNPMLTAIAVALLRRHAPDITVERNTANAIVVHLYSMESFGSAFLAAFLEGAEPPRRPLLLHTIPESELAAFARLQGIPVIAEERDTVRQMLDRIAERQPQTYFSLCKSALRLLPAAERLRIPEDKALKGARTPQ